MFVGIGLVLWPIAVFTYTRINARKKAALREAGESAKKYDAATLRRMGDRAPDFEYTI